MAARIDYYLEPKEKKATTVNSVSVIVALLSTFALHQRRKISRKWWSGTRELLFPVTMRAPKTKHKKLKKTHTHTHNNVKTLVNINILSFPKYQNFLF